MYKQHKKLYKAGKNWVVATLTATTITLLGGIGAYTAHADTTIEITQSIQAEGSNQSSQNNNSDNSVVLTQPLTTQSNQTVLSNQSEQSTPATQATPTAVTNITTTNSFNKINPNDYGAVNESNNLLLTQKNTNDSSLWYTPSVSGFEGDVERSGLGYVERKISDPVYPNITVYYSFLDSTDEPEIQKYAHKEVTRDIYIKDPQTGVESPDRRDLVIFNRWVAVDTTRNNQVVGLGPWVWSLTSPNSFPKYNIPQKNGYTSYCNGKKATMIDEEQVSGNQPDEIYHITYVPTSSLVNKKTRTIIIKFPDGKQESTIQNTALSGNSTCIWPKYVIPARDGYDSYVDGLKTSVVPEQTVDVNDDDNVIVNVTYKMSTWAATHKTITRTIYIHDTDGNVDIIPQTVNFMRSIVTDAQGNPTSYTDWTGDGNFDEYAIPQREGFISQIGSEDTKVVPSQLVNPSDEDTIVNVTYKKTPVTPSKDKHKAITRTIKIAYPSGYVQTISQTVNYTYHTVKIGSEVLAGWVADGNDSWDEYAIPQHDGFISQVDSQDAKIVPSQHVNPNDKDVDVSITYIKTDSSKGNGNGDDNNNPSRLNTGTINYIDPDGKVVKTDQISGKVGDKVDVKISLPDGYELANKDEQIPSSITVGEDGIKTITIQVKKLPVVQTGSINYVDQDGKIVKTDQLTGKVGNKIKVTLSLPDGYELANEDEQLPTVITVTENGIGTINVNVKKINTTNTGWNQQGDDWLYMQNNGYLAKEWNYLNGHWFYFDLQSGIMKTGVQPIGNSFYYLNTQHDGTYGAMKTGWQFVNGHWICLQGSGIAYIGWEKINGHWYYFDPESAYALTNWQDINNHWYYFDPTNAWALTNWAKLNNHWYYFDNTNANALTGWQSINSHWYYFDPTNAWALTGWQYINGHWYWFDQANAWARTGWQYYGGQWYFMDQQNAWMDTGWTTNLANGQLYYLDKNGHPLTGWQRSLNGFWYYLQPGSDAAAIGWNWINGHWYYFNPEETINGTKAKGAMLTGHQLIANRWSYFDQYGHWLGYEN